MRVNRTTGDAFADGDVKSTYSDLKPQPGGALLASSDPIHVTSRSMTAHSTPAIALYTGDARLWQDANVIEAPAIEFDRNRRSVVARGSPAQSVSTVLVQTEKSGKVTPVKITSSRFSYTDGERKAHFDEGVQAKGADLTIVSRRWMCSSRRGIKLQQINLLRRVAQASQQELGVEQERSITSSPKIRWSSPSRAEKRPATSWFTPHPRTSLS